MSRAEKLAKARSRSIEVLSARPDLAQVTNSVSATLEVGARCTVVVDDHTLTVDLPEVAGGDNRGPTPSQLVASALAACIAQGYAAMAAEKGIQLDGVEVTVDGDFDARGMYGIGTDTPAGFNRLSYTAILDSPEKPQTIADLHGSMIRCSPVVDDLTRSVEIDGTYEHRHP